MFMSTSVRTCRVHEWVLRTTTTSNHFGDHDKNLRRCRYVHRNYITVSSTISAPAGVTPINSVYPSNVNYHRRDLAPAQEPCKVSRSAVRIGDSSAHKQSDQHIYTWRH